MIYGIFHKGSGLGNQLHRYVGARCMAKDLGQDFGMVAPELFKGASFLNLDMGKSMSDYHIEEPSGRVIPHTTEIVVDGEFQAERYFEHRIDEVRKWLKTDTKMKVPDDVCIVNFRGGEYVGVKDLFLPISYWLEAMVEMRKVNPNMVFRIVTDDAEYAKIFFQGLDMYVDHKINEDWLAIRYAKYLILSNSSFAILPALLNENAEKIIAPKYWAGRNVGEWRMKDNQYKKFTYI